MSKLLKRRQAPSLRLIKVLEDGSAKTFIYENPDKKNKSGFIARLGAKIQRELRLSSN